MLRINNFSLRSTKFGDGCGAQFLELLCHYWQAVALSSNMSHTLEYDFNSRPRVYPKVFSPA